MPRQQGGPLGRMLKLVLLRGLDDGGGEIFKGVWSYVSEL